MKQTFSRMVILAAGLIALSGVAAAGDEVEVTISLKDHKFEPADVKVPAGKPIKVTLKNLDDDVEEFESTPLKFEKLVAPNGEITIRLHPLDKGTYAFFGEYHEDTAQGKVIAE